MSRSALQSALHGVATFVLCIGAYAATMPRTITLEDAGLFQMVCSLGGISHPPGYPLFTALCNTLVVHPHIVNGNLVSALFGALAAALFHDVVHRLTGDRLLAWVAALAWAISACFWSQSIIIEVYTLAAALFIVCWWFVVRFAQDRRPRWWLMACFAFGLSLTNHWPLMLLSAPALVAAAWPAKDELLGYIRRPAMLAASAGLFLLGLTPYVLLFVPEPSIAIYGGIDSVDEFLRYVSRAAYVDDHATAGWSDKVQYAAWIGSFSALQWRLVGVPFVLLGLLAAVSVLPRHVLATLLLLWLGSTLVLVALLGFEYSAFYRAIFKPYPILAMASVALLFALGVRFVASALSRHFRHAGPLIAAGALVAAFLVNLPRLDRSDAGLVENYARTLLGLMPENAVLFVRTDNYTGPIGYLHFVRGVRPDIEVRDWDNLVFPNRLASPFAPVEEQLARNEAFLLESDRPVFATDIVFTPRINYGAFYEFAPEGGGYAFPRALATWVDILVTAYTDELLFDGHEQYFVYQSLIRFSRQYIGFAVERRDQGIPREIGERVALLQRTFPGKLVTLELLVPFIGGEVDKVRMLELAAAAEQVIPPHATRESLAVFYELVARIHLAEPVNAGRAAEYLRLSIDKAPSADNPSVCLLHTLRMGHTDVGEVAELKRFDMQDCETGS